MAVNIPTDFAQCNLVFEGLPAAHFPNVTFGLDVSVIATPVDAADLVMTAFDDSDMDGITASDWNVHAEVKFGPVTTGPSGVSTLNNSGLRAGADTPPNVALLFHKFTNIGGRSGRGRMYWPAPAEADVDERGGVAGAFVTTCNTALSNFHFALATTHSVPMVLLHDLASPITTPTVVTNLTCDPMAATQRRRLRH